MISTSTLTKSQFRTTENVDAAESGYNELSKAANAIDKISSDIETHCCRKVPKFVKVKDALSENTTTNLNAFKSVCKTASSKIKGQIGGSFEGSKYYKKAKALDDEIAQSKYNAALKEALKKEGTEE